MAQQLSRQIRVFISSTLKDMRAERDYLVKFIFPQLRKLCESRRVTWGEVDLRWGITEELSPEQDASSMVLTHFEHLELCKFLKVCSERGLGLIGCY